MKERWVLVDLKKDESIKILPADKGRTTVILDTSVYHENCKDLLNDEKTYKKLKSDPTQKYKKQFVECLGDLLKKNITKELHRKLYPTCDSPPRFYGLP